MKFKVYYEPYILLKVLQILNVTIPNYVNLPQFFGHRGTNVQNNLKEYNNKCYSQPYLNFGGKGFKHHL